jgi:prepilin-type N-terminal cleavage/methylation domain-containing protein
MTTPALRGGFTLLELTIVLVVSGLTMTIAGLSFSQYFNKNAARSAAQVFAQDLTQARLFAVRSREPVVVRFFEASRWYQVEAQTSTIEVARRRFTGNADIDLSAVTFGMAGDSLVFNSRGIADLSGAGGPLGEATFSSGAITYTVSFNSMGASKIEES